MAVDLLLLDVTKPVMACISNTRDVQELVMVSLSVGSKSNLDNGVNACKRVTGMLNTCTQIILLGHDDWV